MNILFKRLLDIEAFFFACYHDFKHRERRIQLYKLLLLDMDGTLRDERFGIPNLAKEAIRLCKLNHCLVFICTGRSIGTISDDVISLDVDGYIAGGGCYISLGNELLHNTSFSQTNINKVVDLLIQNDTAFTIESQQKVFMNQKGKMILDKMNQSKKIHKNVYIQFIQEKIVYEDNIHQYNNQPVHKICLWSKQTVFEKLQSILSEEMEIAQEEPYEDIHYFEIVQKGCNKGDAIKKLQTILGIKKKEIICFGDGQNDIEMFKASHVGVAMKRSHVKLKEFASSICEDVMNNGIYNELKRRNII